MSDPKTIDLPFAEMIERACELYDDGWLKAQVVRELWKEFGRYWEVADTIYRIEHKVNVLTMVQNQTNEKLKRLLKEERQMDKDIQALIDQATANESAEPLAAAVVANTPAAPPA